jgi:hypothetical protein
MSEEETPKGENTREHEKNETALPWEVPKEELPEDLALVLARMQSGTLQEDARILMEMLPNWKGINNRAEINNNRLDSSRLMDKTLKTLQKKVLGLIKMFPMIHSVVECDETRQVSQQFFALVLLLED